jgi:hypothetical protein
MGMIIWLVLAGIVVAVGVGGAQRSDDPNFRIGGYFLAAAGVLGFIIVLMSA